MVKIVAVLLFFLGLWFFLNSSIFKMEDIAVSVEGADCVSDKEVREISQIQGSSFFLSQESEIEKKLKTKFFCVGSAKLTKVFPSKARLEIRGREPAAVIIASPSSQAAVVDQEGVLLKFGDSSWLPKILINSSGFSPGQRLEAEATKKILLVLQNLQSLGVEVKIARLEEKKLLIDGVYQIYFSLERDIDLQLGYLQLILNQAKIDDSKIDLIDLRFDKPVIRYAKR